MRTKLFRTLVALAVPFLLAACAGRNRETESPPDLLTSLQATIVGDSARFLLQVTNSGPDSVLLEWTEEPHVLFTVTRAGMNLWNGPSDESGAPQARVDTLLPGATRSYRASWRVPMGLRGALTVTAIVRDAREPVMQSTHFQLP